MYYVFLSTKHQSEIDCDYFFCHIIKSNGQFAIVKATHSFDTLTPPEYTSDLKLQFLGEFQNYATRDEWETYTENNQMLPTSESSVQNKLETQSEPQSEPETETETELEFKHLIQQIPMTKLIDDLMNPILTYKHIINKYNITNTTDVIKYKNLNNYNNDLNLYI